VPIDHDQRPVTVPTTPSASPEMTPSGTTSLADVDSTVRECIVQQRGSECDREPEHRLTATAITRSTTNPRTVRTAGERRAATSNPSVKPTPTKQTTKDPRSARAKKASPTPPGHTKRPKG
jgi:hypothetical protein